MPFLGHLGPKPRAQGHSRKNSRDGSSQADQASQSLTSSPRQDGKVPGLSGIGTSSHVKNDSGSFGIPKPKMSKKYHSSPLIPTVKSLGLTGHSHSSSHNKHTTQHGGKNEGSSSRSRASSPHTPRTRSPPPPLVQPRAKLGFDIESPPLVLYGTATESTGALLSGLFKLEILDQAMQMKAVTLAVVQKVHSRKRAPGVQNNAAHHHQAQCKTCELRTTELARWDLLANETVLPKQIHEYPFSHLLPGALPATSNNQLFTVEYVLSATAVAADSENAPITISRPLKITRAIIKGTDKNSIRIFPPTQLTASITLPAVVYPNSQFPFELTLDGISLAANNMNNGKTRWRMRKIIWRVDENLKMKPSQCAAHNPANDKPTVAETRTIGHGEIKTGWKTDFSNNGKVELINYNLSTHAANVSCNLHDNSAGLAIDHVLVVELVVAEETVTQKSASRQAIPTGAARVLRMQFNLIVTERSGLGIAWDDEVPPTYEDVPMSPPDYKNVVQSPNDSSSTLNIEGLVGISPAATPTTEGISERLSFTAI